MFLTQRLGLHIGHRHDVYVDRNPPVLVEDDINHSTADMSTIPAFITRTWKQQEIQHEYTGHSYAAYP